MKVDVVFSFAYMLLTVMHAVAAAGVVAPSRLLSAATAVVAAAIIVRAVQAALPKLRAESISRVLAAEVARREAEAIEQRTGRDPRWRVN